MFSFVYHSQSLLLAQMMFVSSPLENRCPYLRQNFATQDHICKRVPVLGKDIDYFSVHMLCVVLLQGN